MDFFLYAIYLTNLLTLQIDTKSILHFCKIDSNTILICIEYVNAKSDKFHIMSTLNAWLNL